MFFTQYIYINTNQRQSMNADANVSDYSSNFYLGFYTGEKLLGCRKAQKPFSSILRNYLNMAIKTSQIGIYFEVPNAKNSILTIHKNYQEAMVRESCDIMMGLI